MKDKQDDYQKIPEIMLQKSTDLFHKLTYHTQKQSQGLVTAIQTLILKINVVLHAFLIANSRHTSSANRLYYALDPRLYNDNLPVFSVCLMYRAPQGWLEYTIFIGDEDQQKNKKAW